MSRSLADILAAPPSHETQIVPDVCLDQKLRAELQRLRSAREALMAAAPGGEVDGKRTGPPLKAGQKAVPAGVEEIDAELEAVRERMREATGDLVLRATSAGEWQRFKDANPPRIVGHHEVHRDKEVVKGEPIYNATDEQVAYGYCNADALLESLPVYVVAWNGEDIPEDQREAFVERMAYSDRIAAASTVVMMFETRVTIPKSSNGSSATGSSASA